MLIEVRDITGEDVAYGSVYGGGVTLGGIVDGDERLKRLSRHFVGVYCNGVKSGDWLSLKPGANDRVRIVLAPSEIVTAILGTTLFTIGTTQVTVGVALTTLSVIASVAQFIISLVNQPPQPKIAKGEATVYGFEGIRTSFLPGNPIPVVYGQHRIGGQMLSMTIDVASGGKRQEMNLLLGLCEGPITEVNCVRINNIPIESIGSAAVVTRIGGTSQSIVTGFETIRNTFADGREVASGTPITYTTNTVSAVALQFQVGALEGLIHLSADGSRESNWVEYSVERRETGTTTYTIVASPVRFTGKTQAAIWDVYNTDIDTPDQYDFRLTMTALQRAGSIVAGTRSRGRIWLSNVTERSGRGEAYSSTALLALRAVATEQFHGSRPDITALVRGRVVRVYSTTTVSTVTYSRNPAWAVLDYMTNSVYGMGAFVAPADVNLQSFVDFATLCRSLVSDGRGETEEQHQIDLVLDQKRSHEQHVQDMLGLYKSAKIYSQQQWKIISDRQDLPVRQVFHAGNMVADRTAVRIAAVDPMGPNQVNVNFANQTLDYERDTLFFQDSASVFGASDPIKDYDISLFGAARESEVIRTAAWNLQRKRDKLREITFATGLEGIAVEPGDRCRAGIVFTDFEMGFGGRALDGSSSHIVLDREVEVRSGFTYDMFVWHTEADTVEQRTVATTPGAGNATIRTITVSPTAAFSYQVRPNDRWAVGINSEDLMLATVSRVTRTPDGLHEIVAEEYLPMNPTTPTPIVRPPPRVTELPALEEGPAQPMDVRVNEEAFESKDGGVTSQLFIDVSPAPLVEGGRITNPATTDSVTLAESHNPNVAALVGERVYFQSGPASGTTRMVTAWGGSTTRVATIVPAFASVPDSGDPYTLYKKSGRYAGFDLHAQVNSGSDFAHAGTHFGTIAELPATSQRTHTSVYRVIPFSDLGVRNHIGTWVRSVTTFGDTVAPPNPGSLFAVAGLGLDVNIHVQPTSVADLWGHEFFRNTANSFYANSMTAFHSLVYHDTGITYETSYYYWVRARDMSFNVSSPIGPITFVASRVITTDVGTSEITNQAEFAADGAVTISNNSETVVGTVGITTEGGTVVVVGKAVTRNNAGAQRTYTLKIRRDSVSGTELDRAIFQMADGVPFTSTIVKFDTPAAGATTYVVTSQQSGGSGSHDVDFRRLQANEQKR